jgi:hypothetical protein
MNGPVGLSALDISPVPTDEEAAAIVAALEFAWPRAVVMAPPAQASTADRGSWRFSGRWWANRDIAAARRRPF